MGFFDPVQLAKRVPPTLTPRCDACKLYKGCLSPKMAVVGKGAKGILVVGEAPGRQEDEQGRPFVGPAGRVLRDALAECGVDLSRDCWITNSLICRPPRNKIDDPRKIDYCRPNLLNALKELNPRTVLLLGGSAVRSLIGWLWKDDPGGVMRWAGFRIPCQRLNAWVCPVWHPSYLLHDSAGKGNEVVAMLWKQHLAAALALRGRPWDPVPDYRKRVRVTLDDREAADAVDAMGAAGGPLAFDFETDRLKPDHPDARIVCCAMSDGEASIAFPWFGEAVAATKAFLTGATPKVGWNAKFEARWCRKHLGVWPQNWAWDGMLAAHVLDNRPEVTGLKFQAFVTLGQESYDDAVKPYLKGEGGNGRNRVHELPLPILLQYCGLDALLEWHVGMRQAIQMGVTL